MFHLIKGPQVGNYFLSEVGSGGGLLPRLFIKKKQLAPDLENLQTPAMLKPRKFALVRI
jgi:hypothetical protein